MRGLGELTELKGVIWRHEGVDSFLAELSAVINGISCGSAGKIEE
jgi:hypothetical protein